jgi:coronin-1B/1C/6
MFVRPSKLRHVYGEEQKQRFEELRPSTLTSEGHLVKSNGSFVAFNWNISSGSALCVLGINETGRLPQGHALIKGHSSNILDFDFNPFNGQQILTSCEDTFIRLWEFPAAGLQEDIVEPLAVLRGHGRKVGLVTFNPAAAYICASSSFDYTVKVWNIETATAAYSVGPLTETCLSLAWDPTARLLGTTWRDKRARVIDPRSQLIAQEFQAHEGGKASKFCWINESTGFTCGFSKQSERQYCLWDIRDTTRPLTQQIIDQASGVLMPFFDADTGLLFLAGKGDGNIRYYEVVNTEPYIHFIESYKSTTPCQGVSFIPKRKVDVSKCEVMRAVKLSTTAVDLISFIVPRRVEGFQEDLYPDCVGTVPGCRAAQWVEGNVTLPPKFSMNIGEEAMKQAEVAFKPAPPQSEGLIPLKSAQINAVKPATKEEETLKAALVASQTQISALQAEIASLKDHLFTAQGSLNQSKSRNIELQAALNQAQADLYQATATLTALREAEAQAKANSEYQLNLVDALKQEKDQIKEETEQARMELEEQRRKVEGRETELERVKAELAALRMPLAEPQ